MFNLSKLKLGSDKKRELKDNIKEIRGIIESEAADTDSPQTPGEEINKSASGLEAPPRPQQTSGSGQTVSSTGEEEQAPSKPIESNQSQPPSQPEAAPSQATEPESETATDPRSDSLQPPKSNKPLKGQLKTSEGSSSTGEGEKRLKKPEKLQPAVENKSKGGKEQMRAQGPSSTTGKSRQVKEVPKLSQAKKFGQSQEETGPLFIEEEDFYTAEDVVAELNSLSNQLSNSIRNMENTLLEDEELAEGIQKTIAMFEETSEELKSIFTS